MISNPNAKPDMWSLETQANRLTDNTADKAVNTVRNLQDSVGPAVGVMAHKAQELARRGQAAVTDSAASVQQSVNRSLDATFDYVGRKPMQSMLIAAAVGAAATAVLIARSRRNTH